MNSVLTGLLLASLLVSPIVSIDQAVRSRVQASRTEAMEGPMQTITHGSRKLLIAAAVVGLLAGPVGRAVVLEAVVALIPVNLAVEGLKWTVGRTRPDGDAKRKNSSFPSSHAANAWAAAAVLSRRWRRAWPIFAALAALVSFSRMFLDRHWLSDVSAGALLGVGLALLAVQFLRRAKPAKASTPVT